MSQSDPARGWGGILLAVAVLFLVAHVVSFVWFPFLPWMEQREAGEKVVKDQIDAEKAVENYEWFRRQHAEIEAQRNQLQNAYEAHDTFHNQTWPDDGWRDHRDARETHSRLHTRITGSQDQLENLVSEYNARSDMAHRAMFKCHLPYKVDDRFGIQGPPGSGAPETPNDEYVDGANPNQTPPEPENCDGLPDKANSNADRHPPRPMTDHTHTHTQTQTDVASFPTATRPTGGAA